MDYGQFGAFLVFVMIYSCLQIAVKYWRVEKGHEFHWRATFLVVAWIMLCTRTAIYLCGLSALGIYHLVRYSYLKWISTPRPVRPIYELYNN